MRRSPHLQGLGLLLALTGCPKGPPVSFQAPPPDGETVTCPVTRARCSKGPDILSAVLDERTYYFCSEEGWRRFSEAPRRYRDHP